MTTQNFRILCFVLVVSVFCFGNASRLRKLGDLGLVMDLIGQQYIEDSDPEELYEAAMKGMFTPLDPYSEYIPKQALKPFQAVLEQQFGGLGIRLDGPPRRERLTVVSTLYNSPAFRAGVKPGDILLEVDGVEVASSEPSKVTDLIRGKEGSLALLKIERNDSPVPLKLSVPREQIEVESVLGDQRRENGLWEYSLRAAPTIGYFRIEIFGEKTARELDAAIKSFLHSIKERQREVPGEAIQGIILDLRDNTGGLLTAAIEISDMFLDDG